ncbi:DeoR/GlpR family DNA-binding transcription regulator [Actinoplanes sp. NEAU-A12]|uniref:DeoR/GlpR family DNA-binding transcription regulator n=1 Tax=Actinoplanes sandaracinus TaxID=3045177 RepID=A0ABT6WM11_9ACTN|nr:DeoR/GlpR family DNA-binding transcription regulator [Actinoplanes sandaracinus]MDI6100781.1 DeoR/GlpR family DNA-binding transcription regulator [Actinoplanes sandaracinus]
MLIAERRRRLLEQVRDRGYVSFRELAEALDISESTVRRDLRSMVADGLLIATRGGAGPLPAGRAAPRTAPVTPAEPAASPPPAPGDGAPADPVHAEREAIAAYAAGLVVPGSAVLLGPGRTTTALARRLAGISQLTVVTNSIPVTQQLIGAPQIEVVLVGGALRRSIGAVVGPITEQALSGLRGAQVFLSGDGVTTERGLTTPNVFAAATDQAMMAAGKQVVVLADHTKLGHDTMCQTVPSERIDVLVTDRAADPDVVRRLRAEGVDVHLA